jgi:hypothetical protein
MNPGMIKPVHLPFLLVLHDLIESVQLTIADPGLLLMLYCPPLVCGLGSKKAPLVLQILSTFN